MKFVATPIQRVRCRGFDVHIKRDDVHFLSGNKFRKLFWLMEKDASYFAGNHLLSYGGIQSNAMLAVAQLAQQKQVPFTYFTKPVPAQLMDRTKDIQTNFSLAKALGMQHVTLSENQYDVLADTHDFSPVAPPNATTWVGVPQGVAVPEAELGIRRLAHELNEYAETYANNVAVVLPCGTGTTAHYVAKHVHPSIHVYGVPCVGNAAYLRQQVAKLESSSGPSPLRVLEPRKRVAFGTLWRPLMDVHAEVLEDTGVEIDLVYGCLAWDTMLHALHLLQSFEGREVVYVHCGGLSGNASQLERYRNKYKL